MLSGLSLGLSKGPEWYEEPRRIWVLVIALFIGACVIIGIGVLKINAYIKEKTKQQKKNKIHNAPDKKICQNCGALASVSTNFCTVCGYRFPAQEQSAVQKQQNMPPMNWYKFSIYGGRFAGILMNIANAALMFLGYEYGGFPEKISVRNKDDLLTLGIVIGVLYIGAAAFDFFVRQSLVFYRKKALIYVVVYDIICMAIPTLYFIVGCHLTQGYDQGLNLAKYETFHVGVIALVFVVMVIKTLCEYFYYRKRKDLFNTEPYSFYK